MARFSCVFLLIALASFAAIPVQADPPATDENPSISLSILKDPTGTLTIDDVTASDAPFMPSPNVVEMMSRGDVFWFRVELEYPPSALDKHWQLDFNWNFLRNLTFHIPGHPTFTPIDAGDWNFAIDTTFDLPRPVDGKLVCYIRTQSYLVFNIRLDVRSVESPQVYREHRMLLLGLFFGLLGGMLLYNGFLTISLRDSSYFWYVAHLLFLGSYYIWMNGFLPSQTSFNTEAGWNVFIRCLVINQAGLFAAMILFARSFLADRMRTPMLYWVTTALLLLPSVIFVYGVVNPVSGIGFVSIVGILSALVILACSIVSMAQGYKPARIFFVGWVFYLGGGMIHSMSWQGIIPSSFLTNYALQLGTAVEVLVMSLALAYRVRLLQDEKAFAEQSLEATSKEKALLSLILENSQLGIALVRDNAVVWGNRRMANLFGLEGGVCDTCPPDMTDGPDALFAPPVPLSGQRYQERERVMEVSPHGYRHFRMLGRLVDDNLPVLGAVWVVEDVTEQVRLEKFKEDVDSIMRHDLVSPLTAIQLIPEALMKADNLTAEQKRICRMTADATYQMLAQVNSYMAIYKMETGKYHFDPESVDLVAVLSHAQAELDQLLKMKSVEISVSGAGDAFLVLGQESLFHTMLVNLLRNAVEASPPSSRIDVEFRDNGEKSVSIRNRGAVPAEIRDVFFDKHATAGKPGGTGLGTYSARLLAESQKARIEVDTGEPNATTVRVTFFSG